MGAQKNSLIETIRLSTHNICFGWEIKKIVFQYALLSGALNRIYMFWKAWIQVRQYQPQKCHHTITQCQWPKIHQKIHVEILWPWHSGMWEKIGLHALENLNTRAAGFKLVHDSREKWLFPPGKLGRSDSQIGRSYSAKNTKISVS